MTQNLVEVANVSKVFRSGPMWRREENVAVDQVTFSIPDDRPTITGIVGESGSGKTTLAMMLLGYDHPTEGEVIFRGQDLAAMSRQERFEYRRAVQPIFQDPFASFNPFYRIDHVLTTPIERFGLANSRQAANERIHTALETVGLRPGETLGRFPHQLSGGQRQRIMVARTLVCEPELIVADEPVSMVDASLRATILAGLQTLNRDLGISIVYITHDLTTAYQVCDNILVMYSGSVVEAGNAERVIQAPEHPYTQLLVSSIPAVDRTHRWEDEAEGEVENGLAWIPGGCKFVPRCRWAEKACQEGRPPLYQTEPNRAAACIQYDEHPVLAGDNVGQLFA